MKVHVVTKQFNSPWPEDISVEVVKVFKGTRIRAANQWAFAQEKACEEKYRFLVKTMELS